MSFLPKDYKEPVESNYMKFEDGDNTFRVLAEAKVGWEYWKEVTIEGKAVNRPVRVTEYDTIPLGDVAPDNYGGLSLSFFWAFPVYNFNAKKIQILTVKQKTVRRPMTKNINNSKWGDPKDYNFVVSRDKDESGKTVYTVGVEPKEPLDKEIIKRFKDMNIDMNAWMNCDDPFSGSDKEEVSKKDVDKANDEIPF